MLYFKKNFTITMLLFLSFHLCSAQNFIPKWPYRSIIHNISEINKEKTSHHTIMPFIGFENFTSVNAASLGCDFKYSHHSGFALYGNLGCVMGAYHKKWSAPSYSTSNISSIKVKQNVFLFSFETLLGYSKTFSQRHTIACAVGVQGAYGEGLMEYIAAAFRLEYSALITKRYGIHFSITDGVGIIEIGEQGALNRISLKMGPIIYF